MGNRVKINTGQEFTSNDQNDQQKLRDQFINDRILRRFFGDNASACFIADDCKVLSTGGMGIAIDIGLGFQYVSSESDADEPKFQPIYLAAQQAITVSTADPTNPRKDIVCIKANRVDAESESRYIMDGSLNIASQSVNTKSNDYYTHSYVVGTPAGSPSEPAVPSGYVKIATIAVAAGAGSITQGNITDARTIVHRGNIMSTGKHTKKVTQGSPATTWNLAHGLGNADHMVQIFGSAGVPITPDSITPGADTDVIILNESDSGYGLFVAIG